MCDVAERDRREHVSVRLSKDGMARVRELAGEETEGNQSQMLRRLLAEALRARTRRGAR